MLLHDLPDFSELIEVAARNKQIDPGLVEKDYWIMHCLWGLQQGGFTFELKGGTSLSKGYGLIDRFSEDIDILIHPDTDLKYGPNHTRAAHIAARLAFFEGLTKSIEIPGIASVERDTAFDDTRYYRGAGIRLQYKPIHPLPDGLKEGILLEAGFDQVAPNRPCTISSWAYDLAVENEIAELIDNRAINVPCYEPGYTLVEKLQTISTKYRLQQAEGEMPVNFLRHYYDIYCLLGDAAVKDFIGTQAYLVHKAKRFRAGDNPNLTKNEAFLLSDSATRKKYVEAYASTRALYDRDQIEFDAILKRITEFAPQL